MDDVEISSTSFSFDFPSYAASEPRERSHKSHFSNSRQNMKNLFTSVSHSKSKITTAVLTSPSSKKSFYKRKNIMIRDTGPAVEENEFEGILFEATPISDSHLKLDTNSDCNSSTDETEKSASSSEEEFPAMSTATDHYRLHAHIEQIVLTWSDHIRYMHPGDYLKHILTTRGYDSTYFEAIAARKEKYGYLTTEKQVSDYDCSMVTAVRSSDVNTLSQMHEQGRCMNASNRFSESIVHMACRRSSYETVRYLVDNIDSVFLVDDCGRTPLHDACWRPEPHFAIVALLLDCHLDLLRCKDKRGATPLDYVRKEDWPYWCVFLDCLKDKYWPLRQPLPAQQQSSVVSNDINNNN